jgi:hypothetical protein
MIAGSEAEAIEEIRKACETGEATVMGQEWMRDALKLIDDHMIELHERPSSKPGTAGNMGASPKQIDIQKNFFSGKYRVVAGSGANQSGKTDAIGGLCFCKWIRDKSHDGDIYWVISTTHDTMRDIPHRTMWDFLPRSIFPDGIEYSPRLGFGMIPTLHLNLPDHRGKCEVWFKTEESDLQVFESARINGAWWTECQRESIFTSISPRLAARKGWLLMDYVPQEPWHRSRIQDTANKWVYHVRFAMTDNAHNLPEGEIAYQRTIMTEEDARVRIDGGDGAAFGVVIKEFKNQPYNEIDPDSGGNVIYNYPELGDSPRWVYIDVGKYTAALLLTVDSADNLFAVDEVYTLGLNVEENVREIELMLERNGMLPLGVDGYYIDPNAYSFSAANEISVGEQFEREGLPVVPWLRTQHQKGGETAMLNVMRIAFQHHRFLVYDRCEGFINELEVWRHKTDRDGNIDPKERYTGPNHLIDCAKAWVATSPVYTSGELEILDAPDFDEWEG